MKDVLMKSIFYTFLKKKKKTQEAHKVYVILHIST